MKIQIEMAFDEGGALRLLEWLTEENRLIYLQQPELLGMYSSNLRYKKDQHRGCDGTVQPQEQFADVINMYMKGGEDCDSLAAGRAGELRARGWRALNPARGDSGAVEARRLGLRSIPAKVILRTRAAKGEPGLYHCIVKYPVGGRIYYDDPSARLGMYGGRVDLRQPFVPRPDVHTPL